MQGLYFKGKKFQDLAKNERSWIKNFAKALDNNIQVMQSKILKRINLKNLRN